MLTAKEARELFIETQTSQEIIQRYLDRADKEVRSSVEKGDFSVEITFCAMPELRLDTLVKAYKALGYEVDITELENPVGGSTTLRLSWEKELPVESPAPSHHKMFVDVNKAASLLKVVKATVRTYARQGLIERIPVSHSAYHYSLEDVQKLVAARAESSK